MTESVSRKEQQAAPPRAEINHGARHIQQLFGAQLEQFRPGNGLDDVQHQLSGAAWIIGRHRQRFFHAPRDQRNIKHIGIHRRTGEQTDKPVLDIRGLPHRHDVGIGAVTQEAGHRGLRQNQELARPAEFGQHLGAQPRDPRPARLVGNRIPVGDRAAQRPENHEVAIAQPTKQFSGVAPIGTYEAGGVIGGNIAGKIRQRVGQAGRIQSHLSGIGNHHGQQAHGFGQRAAVDRFRHLNVDPGLVEDTGLRGWFGPFTGLDIEQHALGIPANPHDRIHQRDVGDAEAVQQHRDRVDQHRCLVGDDLQCRAGAVGSRGHRDQGLPDPAAVGEFPMRVDYRGRHPGDGLGAGTPVGGRISLCDRAVNSHTLGTPVVSVRTNAGTQADTSRA